MQITSANGEPAPLKISENENENEMMCAAREEEVS